MATEDLALQRLAEAPSTGALAAMADAERLLTDVPVPSARQWRERVYALAEALFQSIRQQLSVSRYGAIAVDRGATLDTAETTLNNADWLRSRFTSIRTLPTEVERLAALDRVVRWTDPGPGGFYDDLGNASMQPHLLHARSYADDPGGMESVFTGFNFGEGWRLSWVQHAETYWETPLEMRYTGLDPTAQYLVRMLYAGDQFAATTQVRLVANGEHEVHPYLTKPRPSAEPLEFAVPRAARRDDGRHADADVAQHARAGEVRQGHADRRGVADAARGDAARIVNARTRGARRTKFAKSLEDEGMRRPYTCSSSVC